MHLAGCPNGLHYHSQARTKTPVLKYGVLPCPAMYKVITPILVAYICLPEDLSMS